jgi:adenine-specific DNA-methyltransferase
MNKCLLLPGGAMLEGLIDRIYNGDCMELLRRLPKESIDLVVTSPPYNIGKEYERTRALDFYLEEQSKVITECARALKSTGSIFWQVGSYARDGALVPLDIKIFPILEGFGLIPRNRIVWIRQHGLHANRKFSARHETILWFTKSDDYKFNLDRIRVPQKYQNKRSYRPENHGELTCNPKGKNPGDIWLFRNVKHNHEEQTIHPCQFPEDLIARIILSTTNEGDVVLDPYMGAATVAVVARDHGRRFVGAEIDSRYYSVALRRISGTPDENNRFPNLKTLRAYTARTGDPIDRFSFDVQVANTPTEKHKSRIYPESHHLNELYRRLSFEEETFSARIRSEDLPDDTEHVVKPRKQTDKYSYSTE